MKSKMNLSAAAAFGGVIAATVTGAQPAIAQTTTKTAQIEEIVVTANRRQENMQKVPIAVTAFSPSSLKQRGVTSTNDLSSAVPGLTFTHNGNYATPFLRGVGNAATGPEAESSVAIYIDGVYQLEESSDLFKFNNVAGIEVDKGPQGTLFGRNATGGVIQVNTKDPTSTPHADVEVGYGNYDTFTGSLYATTGIAKNLAADIAIQGDNQSGGWGRNTSTGGPSFTGSDLSVRSKWLWKPDDDTRVTLALNASRSTGGPGYDWSLLPGSHSLLGTTDTQGFYDVNENYEGKNDPIVSAEEGASLKIEHDFDWARGISITSMQSERSSDGLDQDTEGPEIVDVGIYTGADAYTQEFQLQSNKQSKISWVAGAFFLHDDPNLHLFVSGLGLDPFPGDEQVFAHEIVNSAAGYGQATAEILPATHLTVGLRYTMQHNEVRGYSEIPGLILPGSTAAGGASQNTSSTQSASFEKLTYRFALDHNFTPDILGYVSYNRGFKAGLFNLNNPANPPVKPEVLDAYELGVKNELFNHRLRLNASTFYYQYKEIQVTSISLGSQTFYNGAAATLYGLDGDFTFAATDNLTVSGGLEAMHGTYTNFPGAVSYVPGPFGDQLQPGAPNGINATGNPTVRTPNYSANLAAAYVYPLTRGGNLEANLSWSYTGGYTWDPNARLRQPSVNLVNGSIAWLPNERWSLRLWAENILNKRYYAYEGAQSSGDTFSPAAPATFGVTIGAHF